MKLNKFICACVALLVVNLITPAAFSQQLKTPAPSPTQTLDQAFGLSNIKIEYSRPGVKNRVIFGDLVPYDKIWRTGANATTKVTFGDTVNVEGKMLPPGTYGLLTIPGKNSWEILFNKDLTLGGDVANYKKEDEVMRVTVKPTALAEKVETFTINIADITSNSANIELSWDKTRVPIKVTTEIDQKIMKNIDAALEKDTRPYFSAANYYFDNNKDMATALKWVNLAIEGNPKAYYMVHLKAKIQNKMGDKKGAMESAERSMALAKEGKSDDYVHLNEKLIAELKGK
jgi:hypothetical protein